MEATDNNAPTEQRAEPDARRLDEAVRRMQGVLGGRDAVRARSAELAPETTPSAALLSVVRGLGRRYNFEVQAPRSRESDAIEQAKPGADQREARSEVAKRKARAEHDPRGASGELAEHDARPEREGRAEHDTRDVREIQSTREAGADLAPSEPPAPALTLRALAQASRFRVRRVALRGEWWLRDSGPMVAQLASTGMPLGLVPSGGGYLAVDAGGLEWVVDGLFAARLLPIAHAVYRPLSPVTRGLRSLFALAFAGGWRELVVAALCGAAAGLLGLIPSIATGLLFDALIPGALRAELFQMVFLLSVVAFTNASFTAVRGLATSRFADRSTAALQTAVWDHLLRLPATFFRNYSAGDLASRANGIEEVRGLLSANTWAVLFSAIFGIFNLGLLFYYDTELALLAAAIVAVAGLTFTVLGMLRLRSGHAVRRIAGQTSSLLLQLVAGVLKLRVAGAEPRAFAAWADRHTEFRTHALAARRIENVVLILSTLLPLLASAIFFIAAGRSAGMSAGDYLAFNAAFASFLGSSLGAVQVLFTAADIWPMLKRLQPVLEAEPETSARRADPGVLQGAIELNHVSFSYAANSAPVLDDVSITAKPGEMVAIVGRSGSGKSTLLRLLVGFEQASAGAVYYDGQDLSSIDLGALRRQMGVVLQGNHIVPGTIFHNIAGSSSLGLDEAWEAAKLVALDDDLRAMPMNMQTLLDQGGSSLSGGQRQRLVLARAIARRPRILLLDEATSALDNHTQSAVGASLEKLAITRVVIAHRLSTVARADRIYVLDGGRVVQQGTYAELMASAGPFRSLAERQLLAA